MGGSLEECPPPLCLPKACPRRVKLEAVAGAIATDRLILCDRTIKCVFYKTWILFSL